ncbi:hypothetical protein Tco_1440180 [Tanacetum coccineum]
MMMRLFRSDDKFSQMLTQFESSAEFGGASGSGGCVDDEPGGDEDGDEDEEDGDRKSSTVALNSLTETMRAPPSRSGKSRGKVSLASFPLPQLVISGDIRPGIGLSPSTCRYREKAVEIVAGDSGKCSTTRKGQMEVSSQVVWLCIYSGSASVSNLCAAGIAASISILCSKIVVAAIHPSASGSKYVADNVSCGNLPLIEFRYSVCLVALVLFLISLD